MILTNKARECFHFRLYNKILFNDFRRKHLSMVSILPGTFIEAVGKTWRLEFPTLSQHETAGVVKYVPVSVGANDELVNE